MLTKKMGKAVIFKLTYSRNNIDQNSFLLCLLEFFGIRHFMLHTFQKAREKEAIQCICLLFHRRGVRIVEKFMKSKCIWKEIADKTETLAKISEEKGAMCILHKQHSFS